MYRYLEPKIPTMRWIAKHKWFVPLLKRMMPRKFKRTCGYGWRITYPDASKNKFSMVTHSCIFEDIFKKYGMPEMAKGFCKVDNLMYDALPKTRFSYTERIGEVARSSITFSNVLGNRFLTDFVPLSFF